MITFAYHSARVACKRKGRLALAYYSGPMCIQAFEELRPRVVQASTGAACLVLRMNKSLSLMGSAPFVQGYRPGAVPGAVIVRPDQYAMWSSYAQAMAQAGIRRAVFLDSELELCRQWVDWQLAAPAALRPSGL